MRCAVAAPVATLLYVLVTASQMPGLHRALASVLHALPAWPAHVPDTGKGDRACLMVELLDCLLFPSTPSHGAALDPALLATVRPLTGEEKAILMAFLPRLVLRGAVPDDGPNTPECCPEVPNGRTPGVATDHVDVLDVRQLLNGCVVPRRHIGARRRSSPRRVAGRAGLLEQLGRKGTVLFLGSACMGDPQPCSFPPGHTRALGTHEHWVHTDTGHTLTLGTRWAGSAGDRDTGALATVISLLHTIVGLLAPFGAQARDCVCFPYLRYRRLALAWIAVCSPHSGSGTSGYGGSS